MSKFCENLNKSTTLCHWYILKMNAKFYKQLNLQKYSPFKRFLIFKNLGSFYNVLPHETDLEEH